MVVAGKVSIGIIVGLLGLAAAIGLLRFARETWDDGSEEGEKK
jgi:hypothetical protein